MHKRTTPKIFEHAKQLHRNLTPTEAKLWARLRAHQMKDVHFRNQHAIGSYVVDFCAPRRKLILELDGTLYGPNILISKNMMRNAPLIWNPKAIR
jgi:very-short-patch-repair endonuclease